MTRLDTTRSGPTRRALLTGTAALGLAAAGCGSSSGGAAPSAGATSTTSGSTGGSSPGAASSTGGSSGGATGTLVIEGQPFLVTNFKAVVAAYQKLNPKLKCTLLTAPATTSDYLQQLATQRIGGQSPDIFENDDVLSDEISASGFPEDLVPWFDKKQGLTRSSFSQQFLNSYVPRISPKLVTGLPVSADSTVIFYNTKLFKAAGVSFPKDTWTYAEFLATAKKISAAGKGKYWGVSLETDGSTPPSIWQAQYQPMLKAFGTYVYDPATNTTGIGTPAAIKGWTLLIQPLLDGSTPSYGVISGANGPTFAGGQYGMQISVRALIPGYKAGIGNDWDVAQMPTVNGMHPVGGGSYGLSISSTSKNKDNAWAFLNWFYSNSGGVKLLEDSYAVVPPTIQGIDSGAWRTLPAPPQNVGAFSAAIKDALIAPQLPGKAQAALDDAVVMAVQQVALKGVSVADAFTAAGQTVNAALKTAK